jgi:hypothetical protein
VVNEIKRLRRIPPSKVGILEEFLANFPKWKKLDLKGTQE